MGVPYVRTRVTSLTARRADSMRRLLQSLKAAPMTAAQMGEVLQMSPSGARKYLRDLLGADVVEQCGYARPRLPHFIGYPIYQITSPIKVAEFEKTLGEIGENIAPRRIRSIAPLPPGVTVHLMGDDESGNAKRTKVVCKRGELETYLFGPAPGALQEQAAV